MSEAKAKLFERFTVRCCHCDGPVIVRETWVGREIRCPHCSGVLRVPPISPAGPPARAEAPYLAPKRHFNFACQNCESLLEANTGMSGQPGRCPTCGARFLVPTVDSRTGMPQPTVMLEPDAQDPTPVHAYGASGGQAPRILTRADGGQLIECPRCQMCSPIEADSCTGCGAPFTMEGTPTLRGRGSDLRSFTALFLGIIALAMSASSSLVVFFPAALAVLLGGHCLYRAIGRRMPREALVAVALGAGAVLIFVVRRFL